MRTVTLARKLRREMTLPEVLLWQAFRQRPDGLKFRKQRPAGDYVLDFYCPSARLAIEVDGAAHDGATRVDRDVRRDAWLEAWGVRVLRIPAAVILADVANAVTTIVAAASLDQPLHQPAAGPPPHAGEDPDS